MLLESRPLGEVFVIALQPWMGGALDVYVEIAMEHMAELYVGQRQIIAG